MDSQPTLQASSTSSDTIQTVLGGISYTVPRTVSSWPTSSTADASGTAGTSAYPNGDRLYTLNFSGATGPTSDSRPPPVHLAQLHFSTLSSGERAIQMRLRYRSRAGASYGNITSSELLVACVDGADSPAAVEHREVMSRGGDGSPSVPPFPECTGFALRSRMLAQAGKPVPRMSDDDIGSLSAAAIGRSDIKSFVSCIYDIGENFVEMQAAQWGPYKDFKLVSTDDPDSIGCLLEDEYGSATSGINAKSIEWGELEYELPDGLSGVLLFSKEAVRGFKRI